jgi:hypothetical protein
MMRARRFAIGAALGVVGIFAGACGDSIVGNQVGADHATVFDDLWHQTDLHYSYFELKHINWDSLGAHYRPLALAASSDAQFAAVLADMLNDLHDPHVSLTPGADRAPMRYISNAERSPTYLNSRLIFTRYLPVSDSTADQRLKFGYAAPGIGYVRIPTFEGAGWDGDIDEALNALPNARALVIDVRDNPGGDYTLAADIASRFTDSRRVFAYVRRRNGPAHTDFTPDIAESIQPKGTHFAGPVYVLANRHSFSSAEDFVLAMRSIPTVTIVGDTTGGASGGPITRELPNGWNFQLSEWIEYTAEHVPFDGVGLAPDVVVQATVDDYAHNVDAALVKALGMAVR